MVLSFPIKHQQFNLIPAICLKTDKWLLYVSLVLCHIKDCRLFNAKSCFKLTDEMHIICKHFAHMIFKKARAYFSSQISSISV